MPKMQECSTGVVERQIEINLYWDERVIWSPLVHIIKSNQLKLCPCCWLNLPIKPSRKSWLDGSMIPVDAEQQWVADECKHENHQEAFSLNMWKDFLFVLWSAGGLMLISSSSSLSGPAVYTWMGFVHLICAFQTPKDCICCNPVCVCNKHSLKVQ